MRGGAALWWALCALLLCAFVFMPSAAAGSRLTEYNIEVTVPPEGTEVHYRIRFQYRASPPKREGFKFFGWDRPKRVKVTDDAGGEVIHRQPSQYDQERIDWFVPKPDADGLQTVWVEFDQPLAVTYGWRSRMGRIPWAHQFKIPVDHMSVTSHVPAVINGAHCKYDGKLSHCTLSKSNLFEVDRIKLQPSSTGSGFLILLAMLGVSAGLLAWRYLAVRRALVDERGVLPPAPARVAFAGTGYRAPPELPVATESQLSEEDAGLLQRRLVVVLATLLPVGMLAIVLDGRSSLPMPSVIGLGIVLWIACALFFLGRELSWQTVALPLVLLGAMTTLVLFGSSFGELVNNVSKVAPWIIFGGLFGGIHLGQHMGWIPKSSGSSGSSGCSSCGSSCGGGCGGGCGGCGG